MSVTSGCSTVVENVTHEPKIEGSNQATSTIRNIMANRVNYGQGQG
jgi:hypothetical protein